MYIIYVHKKLANSSKNNRPPPQTQKTRQLQKMVTWVRILISLAIGSSPTSVVPLIKLAIVASSIISDSHNLSTYNQTREEVLWTVVIIGRYEPQTGARFGLLYSGQGAMGP